MDFDSDLSELSDSSREDYLDVEDIVHTLQDSDCTRFAEKYAYSLPSCLECRKGEEELCRFKSKESTAIIITRIFLTRPCRFATRGRVYFACQR